MSIRGNKARSDNVKAGILICFSIILILIKTKFTVISISVVLGFCFCSCHCFLVVFFSSHDHHV